MGGIEVLENTVGDIPTDVLLVEGAVWTRGRFQSLNQPLRV